ncbi:MAG: hypothetical protein M3442_13315 [Chloroflexota bacterium]|nr:hypothetical protein [Chloroflexota bacterium]
MPSLRAHMVFLSELRDALVRTGAEAAPAVEAHWPAALLGSEAPDGWYFSGQQRSDTHALDMDDPTTWPGAATRWLQRHPQLSPGRSQPPQTAAFVVGYFSHVGLDTWEQYQHPDFPPPARSAAPAEWFPPVLADTRRRQAALRALGESPFPAQRLVSAADLDRAPVPDGLPAEAIRRVATGIVPALPLSDPWAISRINPLRDQPDTPEERQRWEAQRATLLPATPAESQALLHSALAFTLAAVETWW